MKYVKTQVTVQIEFIVDDNMDIDQLDCFVEDPAMMEQLHSNGLVKPIKVLNGRVLANKDLSDDAYFNQYDNYEIDQ